MSALRLFAALTVAGACTLWGLLRAAELRKKVSALSSVCAVLEQLRWEITELRTPLPELFPRLSADAPPLCRGWLQNLCDVMERQPEQRFSVLWQEALARVPGFLPEEAAEALSLLGQSLGRFDASEQGQAISRCLRTLERCGVLASDQARTGGRLCSGLGLSLGALLSILLL